MNDETRIALQNLHWLHENRDIAIDWNSDTVVYGGGGVSLDTLCEPGFTPATGREST